MTRFQLIACAGIIAVALLAAKWTLTNSSTSQRQRLAASLNASAPGPSQVQHVDREAFARLLAQDKPVIIDFWAPWCGPCRTQGPILDQVSIQLGDRAIVAKVNVDEQRELAAQYGVRSIPTLLVLRGGKVLKQFVGVQQAEILVGAINTPTS